jgi:hypothetical protein
VAEQSSDEPSSSAYVSFISSSKPGRQLSSKETEKQRKKQRQDVCYKYYQTKTVFEQKCQ